MRALKRLTAIAGSLLMLLTAMTPFTVLAAVNVDGYDEVLRFTSFEKTHTVPSWGNSIYADWTAAPTTDVTAGHEFENLRLQLKFTLSGPQAPGTEKTSTWNKGGYIKLRSVDVANKPGDPDLPENGGPYAGNAEHNFGWNITSQSSNPIRLHAGENELLIPLAHFEGDGYSVNHRGMIDWTKLNRILIAIDGKDMVKGVADHTMTVTYAAVVDVHEPASAASGVRMPTLFGNNMMFQRDKAMNVHGWGEPGQTVEVAFAKSGAATPLQKKTAAVDAAGNWSVDLDAMPASWDEYTMTVTVRDGDAVVGKKTISRILIGEVWAAGGQSNMGFEVMNDLYADEILDAANNDTIRLFIEPNFPLGDNNPQPKENQIDIPGAYWSTAADDGDLGLVSAVGYHFCVAMQEKLQMPVGFLYTAVGGSVIEAWISREAIENDAAYKQFLIGKGKYCDDSNWPDKGNRMSGLYIQKISALKGYNVAGTIWYQGESNSGEPEMYGHAMNVLREDWGRVFGFENGADMPFVFTTVQPWITDLDNPQFLGYFAEGMYEGWKQSEDTDMAMITIYDLPLYFVDRNGKSSDPIHPRYKQPVGERFATAAYNMLYSDQEVEYTAPAYKSHTPVDTDGDGIADAIDVTFDRVGDGLEVINAVYDGDHHGHELSNKGDGLGVLSETDDVHGFAIAGTGGVYVNAKAKIIGKDTVRVWSDGLKNPTNVTYNFVTYYTGGTLKNSVGIPAVPFRSDRSAGAAYWNMQDWVYADANVWTCFSKQINGSNSNWADFLPAWESNADWSYDPAIKAEGRASVKMTYTPDATGKTSIGPVLGYLNEPAQYNNFDTVAVSVKNADDRAKELSLRIQSKGVVYTAAVVENFAATEALSAPVAADSDFTAYAFSLRDLTGENGQPAENVDDVLQNVEQLQFTFADTAAGTVYLDDVRFGFLYDANVDKSALRAELAKEVDPSLCQLDSLAEYETAKQNARQVLADPVANQSQIDRAAQALAARRESLVEINVVGTFSKFERTTVSGVVGNSLYADWTMGDNLPIDLSGYDMNDLRLQLKFTLVMPDGVTETAATFNNFGWIKLRSVDVANKPGDPDLPENGGPHANNNEHNYGWMLNTGAGNPIKLHAGENFLLIPLVNTPGDGYTVTKRGVIDWSSVNRILMNVDGGDAMRGHDGEFKMIMTQARIVDVSVNAEHKAALQAVVDQTPDTSSAGAEQIAAYEAAKAAAQAVLADDAANLTAIADAKKALEKAVKGLITTPGDVDASGDITAADALMALQAATGKITLTDAQAAAADVDGQSGVTAADALLILQFATGKITAF
ncbi:MAG: sialate O-acetylesterase [Acutalibacteraceae bacterium]|jgi:hypothetical protein